MKFLPKGLLYHPNKRRHRPSQLPVYFLFGAYQNLTFFFFNLNLFYIYSSQESEGRNGFTTATLSAQNNAWHKSDIHHILNECTAYLTVSIFMHRTQGNLIFPIYVVIFVHICIYIYSHIYLNLTSLLFVTGIFPVRLVYSPPSSKFLQTLPAAAGVWQLAKKRQIESEYPGNL